MKQLFFIALVMSAAGVSSCTSRHAARPDTGRFVAPRTEAECVRMGGQWIFEGEQMLSKYCYLTKAQKAALEKQEQH